MMTNPYKMSPVVREATLILDRMAAKMGLGIAGGLVIGIGITVFVHVQGVWPGDAYAPVRTILCSGLGLVCGYGWGILAERKNIRKSSSGAKGVLLLPVALWAVASVLGWTHVVTGQAATTRMLKQVAAVACAEHLSVSIRQNLDMKRSVENVMGAKVAFFQAALLKSRGYFPSHDTGLHEGKIVMILDDGTPIKWGWYVRDDRKSSLILDNGYVYVIVDEGWPPLRAMLD